MTENNEGNSSNKTSFIAHEKIKEAVTKQNPNPSSDDNNAYLKKVSNEQKSKNKDNELNIIKTNTLKTNTFNFQKSKIDKTINPRLSSTHDGKRKEAVAKQVPNFIKNNINNIKNKNTGDVKSPKTTPSSKTTNNRTLKR